MYLLGTGALPNRTQWAWIQWHLLTQSVWVARPKPGSLWRSQDVGNVVLTAAKATLGRDRAVAMGTVKGGNAHDERLSGRRGQSPRNRSGMLP